MEDRKSNYHNVNMNAKKTNKLFGKIMSPDGSILGLHPPALCLCPWGFRMIIAVFCSHHFLSPLRNNSLACWEWKQSSLVVNELVKWPATCWNRICRICLFEHVGWDFNIIFLKQHFYSFHLKVVGMITRRICWSPFIGKGFRTAPAFSRPIVPD